MPIHLLCTQHFKDKIHYIRELRDRSINCSVKKTATNKGVSKLDYYPPQTSKWCIPGFLNNYLMWIICTKWGVWKFSNSNTNISKHIVFYCLVITMRYFKKEHKVYKSSFEIWR